MDEYTDLEALSHRACSDMAQVRPVLDKIADKWTILILTVICPKPSRFNEIKRRLDGIPHKALADALKRLERNGLVTRTVIPTQPIGVEYAITPLGIHCGSRLKRCVHGQRPTATRSRRRRCAMTTRQIVADDVAMTASSAQAT